MTTAAQFVAAALAEQGYTECPRDAQGRCIFTGHTGAGANHTKFAAEAGHANGYAWCDTFVVAIAHRTGLTLPSWSAYTPSSANGYRAVGRWHTTDPQPGDQVFYQWPGSAEIDHTGIVVSVDGHTLHTIEGNTSADNNGSQSNGGGVFARTRPWDSTVKGFGRPAYADDPPAPTPPPPQEDDDMAHRYGDKTGADKSQVLIDGPVAVIIKHEDSAEALDGGNVTTILLNPGDYNDIKKLASNP